jgi:hypothetical protein
MKNSLKLLLFYVALSLSLLATQSLAQVAPPINDTTRYNGWWWSSLEGGSGQFVECQGDRTKPLGSPSSTTPTNCFVGLYMYRTDGTPVWYVMQTDLKSSGAGTTTLTGDIIELEKGQTLTGAYKAPVRLPSRGELTFVFEADNNSATMTIKTPQSTRSLRITKFEITAGGLNRPCHFNPDIGWWWNPKESGRGYAIGCQKDANGVNRIFAVIYGYAEDGRSKWEIISNTTPTSITPATGAATFANNWTAYQGGSTLDSSDVSKLKLTGVSQPAKFEFTESACKGQLTIGTVGTAGNNTSARVIPIERFPLVVNSLSNKPGFEGQDGGLYSCNANIPDPSQVRPIGVNVFKADTVNLPLLVRSTQIGSLAWQKGMRQGQIVFLDSRMIFDGYNWEEGLTALFLVPSLVIPNGTAICKASLYKNSGLTYNLQADAWSCSTGDFEYFSGSVSGYLVKVENRENRCTEFIWDKNSSGIGVRSIQCPA